VPIVKLYGVIGLEHRAWGEEIAATIDMASSMIGSLADQFSMPQQGISIKIVMGRHRDGTFH
jgi:hypothetical protein